MNTSHILMGGGLAAFVWGLYREFPVQLDGKFLLQWGPLAAFCLAGGAFLYWKGGMPLLANGLHATGKVSAGFFPTIFWFFPVMGFGVVLAACYEPQIKTALEGKWGMPGAFLASWLSPSSQALTGIIRQMWVVPELRPKLIYCLTATPLISLNIFLIRQMGLGWEISLWIYGTNFLIAILLILPFWLWSWMVGG